jgi:uncharacterized protein
LHRIDEKADEMEVSLEDESVDVIVASRAFNIFELIEDEALLALPLAPRHPQCEDVHLPSLSLDEEASPFSSLRGVKQ